MVLYSAIKKIRFVPMVIRINPPGGLKSDIKKLQHKIKKIRRGMADIRDSKYVQS